ncbi:MAG TPA: hypothetical protein VK666_29640, partial [Chryseolinea sp.]|nr:hypothetical protein [Chryseolinea sp.]
MFSAIDSKTLLIVILAITVASYVFDQLLDYINLRSQRATIPKDVEAFYERGKYLKALAYHRELVQFSFITSALSFTASFAMLVTGGFGWLDQVLRPYFSNDILLALVFFGVIMIISDLLMIPFQVYSTFVIEEKYGFNKTSGKTFVADKLKGYLLTMLVGGLLLATLISMAQYLGPDFWIWFSVLAAAFVLFVNMFYTTLILPLFN